MRRDTSLFANRKQNLTFDNLVNTTASTHLEQVRDRIALVDQYPIQALTAYGHREDHSPCLEQAFGSR